MRPSLSRIATTIVVGLLMSACASATTPPATSSSPASTSASATPSATPGPTDASTASPSVPSLPAPVSLPVRGSGEGIGGQVQLTPGPAGGLYVYIPTARGSVVALLDSSGKPRPGWPIALDDTWCYLPAPATDGSIRLVCGFYSDTDGRAFAFTPDGRPIAGWPVELPGRSASAAQPVVDGDELHVMAFDPGDPVALRLVAVAPDGTLRTGPRFETPDSSQQDWHPQLGPNGTGYLLAFPNEPPDAATGDTEITAFDLDGVVRAGSPG